MLVACILDNRLLTQFSVDPFAFEGADMPRLVIGDKDDPSGLYIVRSSTEASDL